jgi:hypothetical protein
MTSLTILVPPVATTTGYGIGNGPPLTGLTYQWEGSLHFWAETVGR